jgi:hypothetical protein
MTYLILPLKCNGSLKLSPKDCFFLPIIVSKNSANVWYKIWVIFITLIMISCLSLFVGRLNLLLAKGFTF